MSRRLFSTVRTIPDFPYRFCNRDPELIKPKHVKKEDQEIFTTMFNMDVDAFGNHFYAGFRLGYITLLQAIAESDSETLASMCEKTLYREILGGLDDLDYN